MMVEAKAYTTEFYDSESSDLKIKEKISETIADFCAGWRAADSHYNWIPVEERLPKEKQKVLVYMPADERCDHEYICEASYNYAWHKWEDADEPIELEGVTHWTEIHPPKKED